MSRKNSSTQSLSQYHLSAVVTSSDIANVNGRLSGDEDYPDLTVTCGPNIFKVHKAIVCPRSEYFKTACRKGCFKVCDASSEESVLPFPVSLRLLTQAQEGEENLIKLKAYSTEPDVDNTGADVPMAIAYMFRYFYHLNYTVSMPMCSKSYRVPSSCSIGQTSHGRVP